MKQVPGSRHACRISAKDEQLHSRALVLIWHNTQEWLPTKVLTAMDFRLADEIYIYRIRFLQKITQMKRIRRFLSALAIVFTVIIASPGQGFLKAKDQQIVNENGENVLLRGMGLGGWMLQEGYMLRVPGEGQQHRIRARIRELVGPEKTAAFYKLWLANHTRRIDIDSLRAWGFNSVRLPMHYNLYTLPIELEKGTENTWLETGFAITDSLLSWCQKNGMYLILDLHAAPGGQGTDSNISDRDPGKPSLWDSEANRKKTVALWRKLAERYADEPWIGGYDILNEPNWGFEDYENDKNGQKEKKNEPLRKLLIEITTAIREVDRKHMIIIEGNGWGNNYNGMLPPWDDNMVLSFHKYWNYNDDESIRHILEARKKYNVPVWLGETGENSNVWFTSAIALLDRHNIGWAWWPLKKLGSNNPLEVPMNKEYAEILEYWQGKAKRPNVTEAEKGLFTLAEALKLENNIYHRDVVDAMMRQSRSRESIPFKMHVIKSGTTTIAAVDYDMGRNGIAYYDADSANYWVSNGPRGGNRGRVYRNDGVDIEVASTSADTYYINHIEAGEWWQYTVTAAAAGRYKLGVLVSTTGKGSISVSVNNNSDATLRLPVSKTRNQFQPVNAGEIVLSNGRNVIRIKAEEEGFSFKGFTLTSAKK